MASQSAELSGLTPDVAHAWPWLEPGETARFELREMAPVPLIIPPVVLIGWPLFRMIRGSRALCVTDRNLYVIRGRGSGASVLYKAPLGSVRVIPRGNNVRGRYLEVADQRIWLLADPDTIKQELAAANGG
jgi:hypothetical protein